jgi:hypothetical protein
MIENAGAFILNVITQILAVIFEYPVHFILLTAFLVGTAVVCERADQKRREGQDQRFDI